MRSVRYLFLTGALLLTASLLTFCGGNDAVTFDTITTPDSAGSGDSEDATVLLGEPEWRIESVTGGLGCDDERCGRWNDIHGVATADGALVVAVGSAGSVALFDGSDWTWRNVPTPREMYGVWIEGADDLLVVGDEGIARRWDAGLNDWLNVDVRDVGDALLDVWGDKASGQFACGERGVVARWSTDIDTWDVMLFPGNAVTGGRKLEAIWAADENRVFAVGNSIMVEWDGLEWQSTEVTHTLHGVWGTAGGKVYAAGEKGVLLVLDLADDVPEWQQEQVGSIWYYGAWGIDAETVFLPGNLSYLARRSGDSWDLDPVESKPGTPTDESIPATVTFSGVWGRAPNDLFMIGDYPAPESDGAGPLSRLPILVHYARFPF